MCRALPVITLEAALLLAVVAFGPESGLAVLMRARLRFLPRQRPSAACAPVKILKGEIVAAAVQAQSRGFQNRFQFAGADHCIHFRNILLISSR